MTQISGCTCTVNDEMWDKTSEMKAKNQVLRLSLSSLQNLIKNFMLHSKVAKRRDKIKFICIRLEFL